MTQQPAGASPLHSPARAALADASAAAIERIRREIASRHAADDLQLYFLQLKRGAQ